MFHQDPTSENLSRLTLSTKYLPGVLEDMDVHDGAREPCEALLKVHQDPTSGILSRLHLSTKSLSGVLEAMDVFN